MNNNVVRIVIAIIVVQRDIPLFEAILLKKLLFQLDYNIFFKLLRCIENLFHRNNFQQINVILSFIISEQLDIEITIVDDNIPAIIVLRNESFYIFENRLFGRLY
jgi:hypothetical protein